MKRYIVLDRDGTLIEEKNYLADPEQVVLLPGVLEGLRRLQTAGFGLVVVTNQSGIGRGYYSLEDMHAVNQRLRELLSAHGVVLDGIFYCPHAPGEDCDCRKPRTGMLLDAARTLGFDPRQSCVIGDKDCDVELGKTVGARTVLVHTGHLASEHSSADYSAHAFCDAVQWILNE